MNFIWGLYIVCFYQSTLSYSRGAKHGQHAVLEQLIQRQLGYCSQANLLIKLD